jgi:hypothetical protein
MFKDEHRYEVWNEIRQHGIRAFSEQLTPEVLAAAAVRTGVKLVKSPLCLASLVWLGISAALRPCLDFATVLQMTLRLLEDQENFYSTKLGKERQKAKRRKAGRSKHSPYRSDPTQVSEEAFAKARQRMPLEFWLNLLIVLGERFEAAHGAMVCFRGFRLLAIDGTEINLPNWKPLKDYFGTAKNKSGQHNAQGRMVMLQLPLVRVPYRYVLSPQSVGEITLARGLSKHLRRNDLLLMDAGYWSYGLLWDIQNRQAFFAIRLKSGVPLCPVRRLGPGDQLMRWKPKDSRGKWRKEGLPKSIDLRVITYQVPGFRAQKLVTNVLSPERIPGEDWIRLTTECSLRGKWRPGLFHRRWEIETTFRELKVEQGMEGGLRSRTPESIQFEVAGHVVLYLLVRWLIVEAAVRQELDPLSLSFSHALKELIRMHDLLVTASSSWAKELLRRLLDRIAAHVVPRRPGRHYPRKKKSTNHKRKSQRAKATINGTTKANAKTHKEFAKSRTT